MGVILKNDWSAALRDEFEKPYYKTLRQFLVQEYNSQIVYPTIYDIFSALQLTALADTKVVILGQDPYHGPGQAHGLSFSVQPGVAIPPSLQNIYKELCADVGCSIPNHGSLVKWAEQGVLLLNNVLTVRQGFPNSHKGQGWERFTDAVIERLNERTDPVVFILWGSHAQRKAANIRTDKHFIIKSPHPSPLSAHRGFFGSKPFSQANAHLKCIGVSEIDWQIPNM